MFATRAGGAGTPTLGTRLRERALAVNALTTQDYTHYSALAPADRLEELIEIEAARLTVGCKSITQTILDH